MPKKVPLYPHVPKRKTSSMQDIQPGDLVKSRAWMEGETHPWLTVKGGPYKTSWMGQPMNEYKVTNGLTENNVFEDTIIDHISKHQPSMLREPPKGTKFPLGQMVMTRGVSDKIAEDADFAKFVLVSFARHATGDWGNLSEEDKKENEYSLDKHLRLLSAYEKPGLPKIWIIRGGQECYYRPVPRGVLRWLRKCFIPMYPRVQGSQNSKHEGRWTWFSNR